MNGHNLGRHWRIGPQRSLYCPGVWLVKGPNEIVVLDLEEEGPHTIAASKNPIWSNQEA